MNPDDVVQRVSDLVCAIFDDAKTDEAQHDRLRKRIQSFLESRDPNKATLIFFVNADEAIDVDYAAPQDQAGELCFHVTKRCNPLEQVSSIQDLSHGTFVSSAKEALDHTESNVRSAPDVLEPIVDAANELGSSLLLLQGRLPVPMDSFVADCEVALQQQPSTMSEDLMAAACPDDEGLYQFIARKDQGLDYPKERRDAAIQLLEDYTTVMSAIDDVSPCGNEVSPMREILRNELTAIQVKIDESYKGFESLWPALQASHQTTKPTSLSINWESYKEERALLSKLIYEQKWVDLLSSELEKQLSVFCTEHGSLLNTFRRQYGRVFTNLHNLLMRRTRQLDVMMNALLESRQEETSTDDYPKEVAKSESPVSVSLASNTQPESPANEECNEELRDLRVKYNNLLTDLASRDVELLQLSAIVDELRHENAERESDLRAEIESMRQESFEAEPIVEEESSDEDSDGDDVEMSTREKLSSCIYLARITASGQIMWKQAIDRVHVTDEVAMSKVTDQLPCHAFRSMLSACEVPPIRSPTWIKGCMRAILRCAMNKLSDGAACGMFRFPELVYGWFDPVCDSSNLVEGLSLDTSTRAYEEGDRNRWGLYYGAKLLASTDAEAALWFSLLDESEGEDGMHFALQILEAAWSASGSGRTYQCLEELVDHLSAIGIDLSVESKDDTEDVLIPLSLALQVGSRAFYSCCDPSVVNEISDRTTAMAVEGQVMSPENEGPSKASQLCVSLFHWMRLVVMGEFHKMRRKRKALARALFELASTGALTSYVPRESDGKYPSATSDSDSTRLANYPQFLAIVRALFPSISAMEAAALFRKAYDVQVSLSPTTDLYPEGISFASFLQVAEERNFFSRSRPPMLF